MSAGSWLEAAQGTRELVIKQSSECPGNLESGLCGQDEYSVRSVDVCRRLRGMTSFRKVPCLMEL